MYDNISECHCVIVWSHSQVKFLWYFKTSVLRELNILHHCVSTFTFPNFQFFFSHIPRILVTAKLSYFQNFHSFFSISRPNLINLTNYYLLEKNIFSNISTCPLIALEYHEWTAIVISLDPTYYIGKCKFVYMQ